MTAQNMVESILQCTALIKDNPQSSSTFSSYSYRFIILSGLVSYICYRLQRLDKLLTTGIIDEFLFQNSTRCMPPNVHKPILFITLIINIDINDKEALFLLTRTDNKG